MRNMAPNDQSLTRFANAASLFTTNSICRGFQIPAAIPNTIDMISNFSNNPLSITSRQTIHRYLCAIQPEGNQNVVLPLKTHLRERAKSPSDLSFNESHLSTLLACARGSPSPRFALNTNTEGWRELNRLKNRTKNLP